MPRPRLPLSVTVDRPNNPLDPPHSVHGLKRNDDDVFYDAMAHSAEKELEESVAAVIASELAKERGGNVATDGDVAHGEDLLNNFLDRQ
eukprot:scaffold87865_cov64-Cyclotella_meneghiniana.AAC.5